MSRMSLISVLRVTIAHPRSALRLMESTATNALTLPNFSRLGCVPSQLVSLGRLESIAAHQLHSHPSHSSIPHVARAEEKNASRIAVEGAVE